VRAPASPHFTPISLERVWNARRDRLPQELLTAETFEGAAGLQVIRGIPFQFGGLEGENVVLLDGDPVTIDPGGACASYALFVHAAESRVASYQEGFADDQVNGLELGDLVSEYVIDHADGIQSRVPIRRRFAIQQARCGWGSSPFACIPAGEDEVIPAGDEALLLGSGAEVDLNVFEGTEPRDAAAFLYGANEETRVRYPLSLETFRGGGCLWIYALPIAAPDRPIHRITLVPKAERSVVYALTLTDLASHPLRGGVRKAVRLRLPAGVSFNAAHELDEVEIDLGTVISARAALDYDHGRWHPGEAVVEPARSDTDALVEYTAHPQARLHVGDRIYQLDGNDDRGLSVLPGLWRRVRMTVRDAAGTPTAVRLHVHGESGEQLPPYGHHRRVNRAWNHDRAAEFVNVENQYAYVDGECLIDLPPGTVYVEISKGLELAPIRTAVKVTAETTELDFQLESGLGWRERGWVGADTHVHFLSPSTALLEARAEGVDVVNVLACQWGEAYSNIGDWTDETFRGPEPRQGRDGESLVRLGSENRMHVLGHISLLGYSGPPIYPLCTGGPDESAFGDAVEVTMAEWAQQCRDRGGMVVMPHAPTPQLERAADIVLGLVDAIELQAHNPMRGDSSELSLHLNAYGLADWYRYLNLGYLLPLVGGSDKMSATEPLGGIRGYARLGGEFSYESWVDAVKGGDTFVTVGPLVCFRVDGAGPGGKIELPADGGEVRVEWEVRSACLPIDRIEVILGGEVVDERSACGARATSGEVLLPVRSSTWVALRVRGSYRRVEADVAAHTSAVQILVEGSELFSAADAINVLEQIEGAVAFVDTIATRPEAERFRQLRATLEAAHERLLGRMRAAGVEPPKPPLHNPSSPREH
jgi:hypothetical protein